MRIDIVTLFPGMVEPALSDSIVGRARARGIVDIRVHNLRDWAKGRHRAKPEPRVAHGWLGAGAVRSEDGSTSSGPTAAT